MQRSKPNTGRVTQKFLPAKKNKNSSLSLSFIEHKKYLTRIYINIYIYIYIYIQRNANANSTSQNLGSARYINMQSRNTNCTKIEN